MVYNPIDRDNDGTVSNKEMKRWEKGKRKIDSFETDKYAAQFGYSAAYLDAQPELVELFNQMIQDRVVDSAIIEATIKGSKWYQKYNNAWLDKEKERADLGDDAYNAIIDNDVEELRKRFEARGATVPPDEVLRDLAEKSWYGVSERRKSYEDYDAEWLDDVVNGYVNFENTQMVGGVEVYDFDGEAGVKSDELYQLARNYGIDTSMSNTAFTSWFQNTLRRYLDGDVEQDALDQELKDMAKSLYPGLAKQIDNGYDVITAIDPYKRTLINELELADIDFNDPLMQKVVNSMSPDGEWQPLNLYDVRMMARKDERFDYTSTAIKEKTDIASRILKDFGFLG
jgi:transcriptional regulator with XRE-family HTH domain